jgi:hypothetical protein
VAAFLAAIACFQPVWGSGRTWVIFRDRGYTGADQIRQAVDREIATLLPATRQRLLKVRAPQDLLSEADLPISPGYLQEIERITGLKPHALSRALNGASYAFTAEQIVQARSLPFVKETRPVRGFQYDPEIQREPISPLKQGYRSVQDSAEYGNSWLQNALENFIPAHEAGYSGAGVFVGQLDNGWNNLGHRCFNTLEVVAQWDFVHGDSIASGDPGGGTHGTRTLSCFAGYDPGYFIGTAHGVHVALAETESDQYELPIEEDNWAAGIEWLDSLGVVIATSSVSYGTLHSYWELDGNTTVITIAADNAVARGIVVLNSAGNHGGWGYPGEKMSPPADGDSVLAIGAVQGDSTRASFSSIGPTYDGRIKPDLMALGTSVLVASPGDTINYTYGSGTSFSTPLTAGACALLLEANPSLTPMQVHELLKASATQATNPDTLNGWGIYNVWQAIQVAGIAPQPPGSLVPSDFQLIGVHPNPFNAMTTISYQISAFSQVKLTVWDAGGRFLTTLANEYQAAGKHSVMFHRSDLASGIYLVKLEVDDGETSQKLVLLK